MKEFRIKDHIRESRLFNSRAAGALVVIVILTVVLIGRLTYLQIIAHEHFKTLSDNNRINIVPIAPTRGLIYDRDGVLLAQNLPAYSLEITPEQVKDLDATIAELSELIDISEDDIERFHKLRRRKRSFESIPLRLQLDDYELARFAVNRHRFPGVEVVARLVRHYPSGTHTVHVVGYVGRINEHELRNIDTSAYAASTHIGKIGVEKSYEDFLHGTVGVKHVEINASGRVIRVLKETPPIPGHDLYLTIDSRIQEAAENALAGRRGAVVAIEPATGDVLALVSTPTYDPNLFVRGIDTETFRALQGSIDRPLFNRAVRGTYPPGSTLKPFVALAGLQYGKVTPDTSIFCPGFYTLRARGHRYRDWKRGGHGHTNVTKAIAESCDVYFYDLAHALGIDAFHDFLEQFGFGTLTGIDITGEVGALLPSRAWKRKTHREIWYPGETVIAGIGQGYTLATPLQLASATATLAMRGIQLRPRTVRAVRAADEEEKTVLEPAIVREIHLKDPTHWQTIIDAMTAVVHSPKGTARRIGLDAPYRIAGKTGTAQVFSLGQDERYVEEDLEERLKDHALFIAFAPVDDPRIAVAVIVENGGSGSGTAAPVARQVMDSYLLRGNE